MRRVLAFVAVVFVIVCFIILQTIKIPPPDFSAWEFEQLTVVGKVVNKERRIAEWGEVFIVTIVPLSDAELLNSRLADADPVKTEGKILCYLNDITLEPKMGSVVRITGRLKAFERATNPGQFSAAEFYQIMKIDFRLYNAEILAQSVTASRYQETLYQLKKFFGRTLDFYFSEPNAGTLRAMLLGERGQTDAEIKALFQRNGIVHILTISGLHISIIGMGSYQLLRRIAVPIYCAAPLSIGLMISYGIMANMSASSFRAIVMFGLKMAAGLLKRTYDLLTALAVAAILLLIEQPLYLYHSGFLFSFLAVLAIGLFIPMMKYQNREIKPADKKQCLFKKLRPPVYLAVFIKRAKRRYPKLRRFFPLMKLKDAFLTCFLISVCTLPVYFIYYYEFPLYSIFLNIIIIPPMTFVMITGIITMTVGILLVPFGKITAFISSGILDFYEWLCRMVDQLPYNNLILGRPEWWQVAAYCLILLLIVVVHKKIKPVYRYLILVFALMVMFIRTPTGLTITFLDVGQGEAIFIATPNRRYYLIDGGSSNVASLGEYRILPFLKSQGVSRLDGWVITHPHADHYSAFPEFVAKMDKGGVGVDNLILPDINNEYKDDEYKLLENIARAAEINIGYLSQGQSFAADKKEDIYFHCLSPLAGRIWQLSEANAYSTVLQLKYGAFSLLLTGDMEGAGEEDVKNYLVEQNIADGVTILSVAHHGSRNSTDEEFLKLTMPGYAVISAGRDNSYGHPHRELLGRLADSGTTVYITYLSGAVTVKTDGVRMQVDAFLE